MSGFDQDKFDQLVIDRGIIGFFDEKIELSSGRESSFYVNWKKGMGDVHTADRVSSMAVDFARDRGIDVDCFFGVPAGANSLGVLTNLKWARRFDNYGPGSHILPMGREKYKDRGPVANRQNVVAPEGRTGFLEDVVTTGGSLKRKILEARDWEDMDVEAAIVLTDRMQTAPDGRPVREVIEDEGVAYYRMSNALDLLPKAYEQKQPGRKVAHELEGEFEKYGVKPIELR